MRAARLLLIVCLLLGLAAVFFAARASLRGLRESVMEQRRRTLEAELPIEAARVLKELHSRLVARPVRAIYRPDGGLKWPHPQWETRPFRSPERSPSTILLSLGEFDAALEETVNSHERAAVLLAKGVRHRDAEALESALAEPALEGTDMALRAELELFRIRGVKPGPTWQDRVSALSGASGSLARSLLKEAGLEPVRAERALLASIRAAPGVSVVGDEIRRFDRSEDGELVLRCVPIGGLVTAHGPDEVGVKLTEPYGALEVVRKVPTAKVEQQMERQRLQLLLVYGGAGLVILLGTAYALVAMGRAERLALAKSEFVANVTHELKTPLANIRLYAESLREGRVRDGDRDEFVGTILAESSRLDSLVEGLLHAARGPRLEMGAVDGARVLRETAEGWRPRLEREGFAITVETTALPLRADAEALRRALDNLIDNARKYGGENRRVELSGEVRGGEAWLTVRDHGPGIPVGERDRVLQPFHRLESADRKETAGTGLGLSLVVATMEAHGGRVEIESGADTGACVSLVLPVENET